MNVLFHFDAGDGTQGLSHARQALYEKLQPKLITFSVSN